MGESPDLNKNGSSPVRIAEKGPLIGFPIPF